MAEGGGGAVTAVEKQKPHAPSANGPWTLSDQDPSNLPPHTLQSSLVFLPCGPIWAVLGRPGRHWVLPIPAFASWAFSSQGQQG